MAHSLVLLVLLVVSSLEELEVATEGTNSTENHRLGVCTGSRIPRLEKPTFASPEARANGGNLDRERRSELVEVEWGVGAFPGGDSDVIGTGHDSGCEDAVARGGTDPPGQRFVVLPVPLVLFVVSSPEELDVATEGTTSTENHRLGCALGVGFRPGRFQAPAVRAGFLW